MMRLGIFGGTFAPFHAGHEKALKAFFESAELDRCLVIPAGIPPHKRKSADFTDSQRLEMTRLACEGLPWAEVSEWELQQEGASYTCKTLQYLSEKFPDARLVLYVGSDMFLTLQSWYRPEEIFRLAEIAAFSRTGEDLEALTAHGIELKKAFPHLDYTVYTRPPFPISSTEIRQRRKEGKPFADTVCPRVYEYLCALQREALHPLLKTRLSDKRLRHSEGVMQEARELAKRHGCDEERAALAGLIHDMTKEFSAEEHFALFEQYDYPLDENLKTNRNLWHAHSASLDLQRTLGITDAELISAVRYHTTGKENMTLLEAILFTADAVEPTRNYADLPFYRALAREDVYKAAYLITAWTMEDLKKRDLPCHEDMIKSYLCLQKQYPDITLESEQKRMNYSTKGS